MRSLLGLLPLVGCAAMMAVCMRMMAGGHKAHGSSDASATNGEVDQLRQEVADLRARLDAPDVAARAARN